MYTIKKGGKEKFKKKKKFRQFGNHKSCVPTKP